MTIYTHLPPYLNHREAVLEPSTNLNIKQAIEQAKAQKLKYRKILVLSKNLRGKTDLFGQPYKPNEYLFVEQKGVNVKQIQEMGWDNIFDLFEAMNQWIGNGIYSDVKLWADRLNNEQIKAGLKFTADHNMVKLQHYLINAIK